MIQGSLARRYAKAFVELAKEANQLEAAQQELESFSQILATSAEFFRTLCNRTISQDERLSLLSTIIEKMGLSQLTRPFLLLLLEKERMNIFQEIFREALAAIDEEKGLVRAEVRSAVPLSTELKAQLAKELSTAVGKKVDLQCKEDPSLISGVWARIGHTVFDGSVTSQLESLKQKVLQRNRHA